MSAFLFRWGRIAGGLAWSLCLGCSSSVREPIPSRARRIVSLGPSATEAIVALGALDRLVGRSRWDRWPDTVQVVPEVGDAIRPSVERLISAQPDLVVLYPAADNAPAAEALARAGIRVLSLRIDSVQEYLAALDSLGRVLGEQGRADSLAGALRSTLDSVRSTSRGRVPLRVFFPVWDQPLMTLGKGSYLSELAQAAGAENVYGDRAEPSFTVSLEDVIARDPDVLLTTPVGRARILGQARWQGVRAVREGRVLAFDTSLVSQPSTRMGAAAASLAVLLGELRR